MLGGRQAPGNRRGAETTENVTLLTNLLPNNGFGTRKMKIRARNYHFGFYGAGGHVILFRPFPRLWLRGRGFCDISNFGIGPDASYVGRSATKHAVETERRDVGTEKYKIDVQ